MLKLPTNLKNLKEQVILLTGATSGIGRELSFYLYSMGLI